MPALCRSLWPVLTGVAATPVWLGRPDTASGLDWLPSVGEGLAVVIGLAVVLLLGRRNRHPRLVPAAPPGQAKLAHEERPTPSATRGQGRQLTGAAPRTHFPDMRPGAVMDHRWADLARTLRSLGMWEHLPEDEAAVEQRMVAEAKGPSVTLDEDFGVRWFFVDGQEMAEGGVERTLRAMAPGLRGCGIELQVETVNRPIRFEDGDYVVAINGRHCRVWSPEDWPAQRAWKVSTVRALAVVNDLLGEASATRRLFTLHAGTNDGIAWLVDPRIVAAIVDSGLGSKAALPALASHA